MKIKCKWRRGAWTDEENDRLTKAVATHGQRWVVPEITETTCSKLDLRATSAGPLYPKLSTHALRTLGCSSVPSLDKS